jgi:hypothetical protein
MDPGCGGGLRRKRADGQTGQRTSPITQISLLCVLDQMITGKHVLPCLRGRPTAIPVIGRDGGASTGRMSAAVDG